MAIYILEPYMRESNPFSAGTRSLLERNHSGSSRYALMVEQAVIKLSGLNTSPNKPRSIRLPLEGGHFKWEGHVLMSPYRLDFQGFTSDKQYGNWQIQVNFGRGSSAGTVAQVLLQCGREFGLGQFIEGFRRSLAQRSICRVMMR
jgi:hypothetical protein